VKRDMEKIKILHVFPGYGGGISSLLLNLATNADDRISFDLVG